MSAPALRRNIGGAVSRYSTVPKRTIAHLVGTVVHKYFYQPFFYVCSESAKK